MHQRKLLIVEDDDALYDAMLRRLSQQMTAREMDVKIERATTLVDAKQKMRTFAPTVVSTDMAFPVRHNDGIERNAGIHLVAHIHHRHKGTPCVVYTSNLKEDIEERLGDAGIDEVPPVFEKGVPANESAWTQEVMDLLLKHA